MYKYIKENKKQVVNSDKKVRKEGIGRNNEKAQEEDTKTGKRKAV